VDTGIGDAHDPNYQYQWGCFVPDEGRGNVLLNIAHILKLHAPWLRIWLAATEVVLGGKMMQAD
jgi:hypothetical protein